MKRFTSWLIGLVIFVFIFWLVFFHFKIPLMRQVTMIILLAFAMGLVRVMFGPTAADRSVAVDMLGILVVGFCGIMAVFTGHDWYIDIGIAWALQSFIGTLALAKFLEGRRLDE